jgi:hypothetical protein
MEPTFDQNASLRLIHEMIETSKSNIKNNSVFFLLWGWLVLSAAIIHFILLKVDYQLNWLPWPVLMISGSIVSVIIGIRIGRKSTVWSYIDKMMVYLWWGFFFTIMIIIVFANLNKLSWEVTQPLIIALYGMGTYVSGGVLRFRPLIWGGIFSWLCSAIAFLVPYEYGLLLVAASILVAYLIPGYIMQTQNRRK